MTEHSLHDQHHRHLLAELGSPEAVSAAVAHGARSITAEEAQALGYGIRGTDGKVHFLAGLLLPFSGEFGQLRPDEPIIPFNGKKPAKYISRAGKKQTIATFGDGDPEIATEGWKDALATHLATGKPTCAIAGVSSWKLLPPSVKLLIYDADAATKPGVWGALAAGGLDRRGLKLAFFPTVDGDTSAGACEYFRRSNAQDFESIQKFTARNLIHNISGHWSQEIRADLRTGNIKALAIAALRAGFDENTVTLLVEGAARGHLRVRVELARDILGRVFSYHHRQLARKRRQERIEKQAKSQGSRPAEPGQTDGLGIDDLGEVATTFGHIVFNTLFGGGKGYASIGGTLYEYQGNYHALVDMAQLRREVTRFASNYGVERNRGEMTYPYATTSHIEEAIKFLLAATGRDSTKFNPGGYVNCTNGVLRLSWGGADGRSLQLGLIRHSPDLIFTSPPGCAYNPQADPSEFNRMMECLPPDGAAMLMERMGCALDVPTVRKHRDRIPASFLIGGGSNGKDTVELAFSRIIGNSAVSGCRISDFKNFDTGQGAGRFNLADLSTSRANISSENSAGVKIEHCEALKAAISGERITVESKSVPSWPIWPQCVMFFNFNTPPLIDGVTAAIGSRIDIFSFEKTYSAGITLQPGELPADPRFKNNPEWMAANALPSMLNAMLAGLQQVVQVGFSREAGVAAMKRIQDGATHLAQLLDDLGLEPGTRSDRIGKRFGPKELMPYINDWYLENGWADRELDRQGIPTGRLFFPATDRGADHDPPIRADRRIVALLKRVAPNIGTVAVGQRKTALTGLRARPGSELAHLFGGAAEQENNSDSGENQPVTSPGAAKSEPNQGEQVKPNPLQENQGDPSDPDFLYVLKSKGDIGSNRHIPPIGNREIYGGENLPHFSHLPCGARDLDSPADSPGDSLRLTPSPPPPPETGQLVEVAVASPVDPLRGPRWLSGYRITAVDSSSITLESPMGATKKLPLDGNTGPQPSWRLQEHGEAAA